MADKATVEPESFYSKLGIPIASLKGAREAIEANRTTGNVVCLVGEAGIGKTQLVQQIAANRVPLEPFEWQGQRWEKSVPMKTLYLAHMQAEDIGVPYPTRAKRNELLRECSLLLDIADKTKDSLSERARTQALSLAEHILSLEPNKDDHTFETFEFLLEKNLRELPPEGILFFDEWTRADKSVVKAFFTIIEDRMVHGTKIIPPGIQIIAAMNPSDANYSVNEAEKDCAFRRRLSFVSVVVNTGLWLQYAKNRFHPYVVEFIKAMPNILHDAKLRDAGKVYPCPATWEKASNILKTADQKKEKLTSDGVTLSIAGCVGQAVNAQFMAFINDNEIIINPREILQAYTDKSDVRKKVQQLVVLARNDVLNEICEGVAVTLLTEKPEPETIAPQLALFMSDLMSEMALAFITHKLSTASSNVEDAESYITKLSIAMSGQPAYVAMFERVGDAIDKAHNEAEGKNTDAVSDTDANDVSKT
ncbi:MAG: AAA family ATPase [Desulfobacteraceae bacterium]|jgi:MoxR-like ATPase